MKKTLLLYVLGFAYVSGFAQDGFKFKIKIDPNTTYTTQMESSTDGIIDFIVDEALEEQMKANGVESPMKMQQETNMTMISKTENRNAEGNIPATMTYENIVSKIILNGNLLPQEQPLKGMKILGHYDIENKYKVDSIIGDGVTEHLKNMLYKTLENIQKQIRFPEENITMGSSFENEIPMSIPMQGMNPIEIQIKSKFTLKEVKNNIAYFDTEQSIALDSKQEQINMTATGTGNGSCEFSIDKNHLTKYESELPMIISMKVNDMVSVKMNMDTQTNMSVTIE